MNKFEFAVADSIQTALEELNEHPAAAKVHAGGVDLVGELKHYTAQPDIVVDISEIPDLKWIADDAEGTTIGASVKLIDVIRHEAVSKKHAALQEAASVVGSPQIRNMGTIGGNLCQRPRCWYYRDEAYHCLKKGGDECFSVAGRNRNHCILGGGPCYIVHPSDCAPALIALNASVALQSVKGKRELPLEDFFILPESDATRENVLQPGEILTYIHIPAHAGKSAYIKFREKEGFDWALSACAAALEFSGKTCRSARVVLGGVAPIPWRVRSVESYLQGKEITEETARRAGEMAVEDAMPLAENANKVLLTKAIVKQALLKLNA
ncbi:MAG: xanthine dehydrogenase family protein subunit M [Candidatus Omnitrophica bacterium]|nr:xanthine dehydrogenase family protein subunit M [Candidatus Omnitrophota bacterium]